MAILKRRVNPVPHPSQVWFATVTPQPGPPKYSHGQIGFFNLPDDGGFMIMRPYRNLADGNAPPLSVNYQASVPGTPDSSLPWGLVKNDAHVAAFDGDDFRGLKYTAVPSLPYDYDESLFTIWWTITRWTASQEDHQVVFLAVPSYEVWGSPQFGSPSDFAVRGSVLSSAKQYRWSGTNSPAVRGSTAVFGWPLRVPGLICWSWTNGVFVAYREVVFGFQYRPVGGGWNGIRGLTYGEDKADFSSFGFYDLPFGSYYGRPRGDYS